MKRTTVVTLENKELAALKVAANVLATVSADNRCWTAEEIHSLALGLDKHTYLLNPDTTIEYSFNPLED